MILFMIKGILTLLFIYLYRNYLDSYSTIDAECADIMNKLLFQINIKFCVWNILHIFSFFVFCLCYKPKYIRHHILIFFMGILWLIIESKCSKKSRKPKCNHKIVYQNNTAPRYDDILFNTTGQLLYIISTIPL